jgi:hypothetical protein
MAAHTGFKTQRLAYEREASTVRPPGIMPAGGPTVFTIDFV